MRSTIKFLLKGFNQLFWPAVCVNCRSSITEEDNNLCKDCWEDLLNCAGGFYCKNCGVDTTPYAILNDRCPACLGKAFEFDAIARAGVYNGALRRMILAFKSKGRTEFERQFCFLAESALMGGGFADDIEMFVPVPLHWRRRLIRGYNQSMIISSGIKTTVPVNADLVRIRNTKPQFSISVASRMKNIRGAFAVRDGHQLNGKNICLVDDIKTTGATLNECAKTLKQAGAGKVYALVLAIAGQ